MAGAAGRQEPVEDGRFGCAFFIPKGIAVRLPLVGENGEPADYPVAEQAAQPPDRLEPAPQTRAQGTRRRASPGRISPYLVPVVEQHVRQVAGEIATLVRNPGAGLQLDHVQQRVEHRPIQRPVQRVKGTAGEPILHGQAPRRADHALPQNPRDRIPARPERGKVRRAPSCPLLRAVTVPGLDHDRASPLRPGRPGHPRLPCRHERLATVDPLTQLPGDQQADLTPGRHPGHHAAIVGTPCDSGEVVFRGGRPAA